MKALLNGGVLAAITALSLAACGGGGSTTPPAPAPTQAGAPTPVTSASPTANPSASPTATPTATPEPTPTPTATPTLITTADYSVVGQFICWNKPSGGSGFDLYFGYNNKNDFNVEIKRDSVDANNVKLNTMSIISTESGTSASSAQPETFVAGDHTAANDPYVFKVSVPGETTANWDLDGNPTVIGTTSGTKCGSGSGGSGG